MSDQPPLWHDDINDALRTCVQALGGAKRVGAELFPELAVDKAGVRLLDALNTERSEVLSPDRLLWILRAARRAGCHAGMAFLCEEAGYRPPEPVEPADEMAELQREFVAAVKQQEEIVRSMERLSRLRTAG